MTFRTASATVRVPRSQRRRGLRTNVTWAVTGNIVYALTQWVALTALAKLGSPDMVGHYALAAVLTNPIIAFANLQLRSLQATEFARPYRFADYFGLRLVTTLGAFAIAIAIATLAGFELSLVLVFLLMMMRKCIDSLSDICFGSFQRHERMDYVAISMITSGSLSLVGLGVAVHLTDSLAIGLGVSLVASIFVFALYTIPATKQVLSTYSAQVEDANSPARASIRPRWSLSTSPALIRMAAPLGVVTLLVSVGENAPSYLVGHVLGTDALGIFAALWYVTTAGSTAVNAIAQSLSPRLAILYTSGAIQKFRRLLATLVVLGLCAGAIGGALVLVVGERLITVAYTAEYAEWVNVLFLLMIAAGIAFAASFLSYGLIAARRLRAQVPLLGVVTLVAVVGSAWLIPRFGLSGAAVAIATANAVQLVGSIVLLVRTPGPTRSAETP